MKTVAIIGAGGHGQVIADVLHLTPHYQPIGFIDDRPALTGTLVANLPILGTTKQLDQINPDTIIIAIGDNQTRRIVYQKLQAYSFATAIHPTAIIAKDTTIGNGTMICAGAIINPGTVIGQNTIINTAVTVDHHNQIGDHVHLAPGTHLGGEVIVSEGGFVGIGATIMPRRTVGKWATVGAGALVQRNVAPETTVVGVPAHPLIPSPNSSIS